MRKKMKITFDEYKKAFTTDFTSILEEETLKLLSSSEKKEYDILFKKYNRDKKIIEEIKK